MPDFTITDDIVSKIVQQCKNTVNKKQVESLLSFYNKFAEGTKYQYLAHVIRTMEEKLRKVPGNEMFQIICSPVAKNSKMLDFVASQYQKNCYFAIYYHPNLKEKQLRIRIAHELGHLFLVELIDANVELKKNLGKKALVEPLATIFAIFSIFDKNDFYHNRTGLYKHTTPEEILRDFEFLIKQP